VTTAEAPAPRPCHRLIPSQFPPIGLFDSAATAADLAAVMELAGWTNDRLVAERIARLPQTDWVYGKPNSSVVMASFLHVAPGGMRFNGPDLGAWYAAARLTTAVAEVGHHLRREAAARGMARASRRYRAYSCTLTGAYRDLRGRRADHPEAYAADSYAGSQLFGEAVRASGGAGIIYDSLRHEGGLNVAALRPRNITDVTQADHYEITVSIAAPRIEAVRLTTEAPAP
jgi:RES domain